jgi:hypothetical protein
MYETSTALFIGLFLSDLLHIIHRKSTIDSHNMKYTKEHQGFRGYACFCFKIFTVHYNRKVNTRSVFL